MKFQKPSALKSEHEELHGELGATKVGGHTGEAAKAVAKLMHTHFVKEEEYALPPLGLLTALSKGRIENGMAEEDDRHARSRAAAHGHCQVNRKFADQRTVAVMVHAATVA